MRPAVSADGRAFLPQILPWLRGLLSDALPSAPGNPLAGFSLPISGSGTYDDPWALPITTTSTANIDALVWLEPAGPPPNWAAPLIAAATGASKFLHLASGRPESRRLPAQTSAMAWPTTTQGCWATRSTRCLRSSPPATASCHLLRRFPPVRAGRRAPRFPALTRRSPPTRPLSRRFSPRWTRSRAVQAMRALCCSSVRLSAITPSGPRCWLIPAFTEPQRRIPISISAFTGVDPTTVDLTTITAQASWYTADLGDDGTGNLPSLTAQIGRLVARVQQLNGSTPVTLVAHSTAGVAALAFTAANPTLVQGLITLGTPHLGSSVPFLSDARIGDALRVVQLLRPQIAASPLRDALDFIVLALDGFQPPATTGALPSASPFPAGSFPAPITAPASINSGSRPVLAIGSQLSGNLLDLLKPALSALANSAANPGVTPPAPTHIAFGARAHVDQATTSGNFAVDTTVRGDLFQLPLKIGRSYATAPGACAAHPGRPHQPRRMACRRFQFVCRNRLAARRRARTLGRGRRRYLHLQQHIQSRSHRQSPPGLVPRSGRRSGLIHGRQRSGTARRGSANHQQSGARIHIAGRHPAVYAAGAQCRGRRQPRRHRHLR